MNTSIVSKSNDSEIPRTGSEITVYPKEYLISDSMIYAILKRFAPYLHKGISEADTFSRRGGGYKLADVVTMYPAELALWQEHFGIISRVEEMSKSGKLVTPDFTEDINLPAGYVNKGIPTSDPLTAIDRTGKSRRRFTINLEPTVKVPIVPFIQTEDIQYFLKPQVHLGGKGGQGSLYNAFLEIATTIQDGNGNWVCEHIPGTGVHIGDEGPVYAPYTPARGLLQFNTRINPDKPNSLETSHIVNGGLMMHCDLNRLDDIDSIEIPNDPILRFWFWQLDQLMQHHTLAGNSPLLLGE